MSAPPDDLDTRRFRAQRGDGRLVLLVRPTDLARWAPSAMLALRILVASFAVAPLVAPAGFVALGFVVAGALMATCGFLYELWVAALQGHTHRQVTDRIEVARRAEALGEYRGDARGTVRLRVDGRDEPADGGRVVVSVYSLSTVEVGYDERFNVSLVLAQAVVRLETIQDEDAARRFAVALAAALDTGYDASERPVEPRVPGWAVQAALTVPMLLDAAILIALPVVAGDDLRAALPLWAAGALALPALDWAAERFLVRRLARRELAARARVVFQLPAAR
jgi:hypothetical protein